jgi:predicted DNA-binding antitoxin AbrB/MazE fold protein
MTRQLEAVFEGGVLRPLEPLLLKEKQHVVVTITDTLAVEGEPARKAESEWLDKHGHQYLGQWVALHGNILLSHGSKARIVRDQARQKGVLHPLLVHLPEERGRPSTGLL